ncbi:hypothetical protein E1301_Tti018427 [Triplophysa tibetana]|uniref:Uncharacterized protein n=1 Tax=Triplophysa tibetana TaxID=1572043 RepID=A0A5A9PD68_9TELE|nr:hypothetical protein E1301_Tti018427 [Triplophysa tibetana]
MLSLGPQPSREALPRGAMRWCWTSGGRPDPPPPPGCWRWLFRVRAVAPSQPPFPAPHLHGCWQQDSGSRPTALTHLFPLGRPPPHLGPGARQRALRPSRILAPEPPPGAVTGGRRTSALPELLSTEMPLSSEGSPTALLSFLPGFGTNVEKCYSPLDVLLHISIVSGAKCDITDEI